MVLPIDAVRSAGIPVQMICSVVVAFIAFGLWLMLWDFLKDRWKGKNNR